MARKAGERWFQRDGGDGGGKRVQGITVSGRKRGRKRSNVQYVVVGGGLGGGRCAGLLVCSGAGGRDAKQKGVWVGFSKSLPPMSRSYCL